VELGNVLKLKYCHFSARELVKLCLFPQQHKTLLQNTSSNVLFNYNSPKMSNRKIFHLDIYPAAFIRGRISSWAGFYV